jgi:hypothetical protein
MNLSLLHEVANVDESILLKSWMKSETERIDVRPIPRHALRKLWTRIRKIDHQVGSFDGAFTSEGENLSRLFDNNPAS